MLLDNPGVELLISDVKMPRLDGRELIRLVRSSGPFATLPLIVVSGAVGPHEISDLLESGASRFLPKPVEAAFLRDYIRLLLPPDSPRRREEAAQT